jgi:hypothetical protein
MKEIQLQGTNMNSGTEPYNLCSEETRREAVSATQKRRKAKAVADIRSVVASREPATQIMKQFRGHVNEVSTSSLEDDMERRSDTPASSGLGHCLAESSRVSSKVATPFPKGQDVDPGTIRLGSPLNYRENKVCDATNRNVL